MISAYLFFVYPPTSSSSPHPHHHLVHRISISIWLKRDSRRQQADKQTLSAHWKEETNIKEEAIERLICISWSSLSFTTRLIHSSFYPDSLKLLDLHTTHCHTNTYTTLSTKTDDTQLATIFSGVSRQLHEDDGDLIILSSSLSLFLGHSFLFSRLEIKKAEDPHNWREITTWEYKFLLLTDRQQPHSRHMIHLSVFPFGVCFLISLQTGFLVFSYLTFLWLTRHTQV